jgi:hypothetical protein
MAGLPDCPVCGETWGCPHCLLEWYCYPGERLRGVLWPMVDRMQDVLERLLVECSLVEVPPRQSVRGARQVRSVTGEYPYSSRYF